MLMHINLSRKPNRNQRYRHNTHTQKTAMFPSNDDLIMYCKYWFFQIFLVDFCFQKASHQNWNNTDWSFYLGSCCWLEERIHKIMEPRSQQTLFLCMIVEFDVKTEKREYRWQEYGRNNKTTDMCLWDEK